MIAVEAIIFIAIAVMVVATVSKIGRPIAEAYSERMKAQYKELSPDQETSLKRRVAALEEEVRQLKNQIIAVQEAADYTQKLLDSSKEGQTLTLESGHKQAKLDS